MDTVVCIDLASQTFRAGYAHGYPSEGCEEPRVRTPCAVNFHQQGSAGGTTPPAMMLPIEKGVVTSWEGVESLMHYSLYDQLGWEQGYEGALVVADPVFMPRRDRETLTQLSFEVFNTDGLYLQDAATLALYAVGKLTGCVLDVGHGKIDVATVTDGLLNLSTAQRLEWGGEELTAFVQHLALVRAGAALTLGQAEALKKLCASMPASRQAFADSAQGQAVAAATDNDGGANTGSSNGGPNTFALPDGQQITLPGNEGHMVAEALMDPGLLQQHWPEAQHHPALRLGAPGIAQAVSECVAHTCAIDLLNKRSGHSKNILVCGGGALIPGLASRVVQEVKHGLHAELTGGQCLVPEYMQPAHTTEHMAWAGAAVLGRVLAQAGCWVTKAEYNEYGPQVVHRKCG